MTAIGGVDAVPQVRVAGERTAAEPQRQHDRQADDQEDPRLPQGGPARLRAGRHRGQHRLVGQQGARSASARCRVPRRRGADPRIGRPLRAEWPPRGSAPATPARRRPGGRPAQAAAAYRRGARSPPPLPARKGTSSAPVKPGSSHGWSLSKAAGPVSAEPVWAEEAVCAASGCPPASAGGGEPAAGISTAGSSGSARRSVPQRFAEVGAPSAVGCAAVRTAYRESMDFTPARPACAARRRAWPDPAEQQAAQRRHARHVEPPLRQVAQPRRQPRAGNGHLHDEDQQGAGQHQAPPDARLRRY